MNGTWRSQHPGWTMTLGILLIVLGLTTLGAQVFTTLVSVYFIGWVLVFAGITEFFYGVFSGSWSRFFLALLGGVFSFIIGAYMISSPALSAGTITALVGILLLIIGTYKSVVSIFVRESQWGWELTGGLLTLMLGVLIFTGWPGSGLWVIGLFIGIELFINGFILAATAYQPVEDLGTRETAYLTGAKGGKAESDKDKRDKT